MNVLALDLGTNTGYVYNNGSMSIYGHWTLATPQEVKQWGKSRLNRKRDPRPQRLCAKVLALGPIDTVIFEDCQFLTTTYQAQLWSALRTSLWMCLGDSVKFEAIPVGTLKKFATGYGNATKLQMRMALDDFDIAWIGVKLTDDEVDALWLWNWAVKNFPYAIK